MGDNETMQQVAERTVVLNNKTLADVEIVGSSFNVMSPRNRNKKKRWNEIRRNREEENHCEESENKC